MGVGEQQVFNLRPIGHRAIYVDRWFLCGSYMVHLVLHAYKTYVSGYR